MFSRNSVCDFFSKKEREECSICMENRVLHNFCNSHSFCEKCCKEWSKENIKCPVCRQKCTNMDYLKYNYYLLNLNQDFVDENNLEDYFERWHMSYCIRKKHLFSMRLEIDWFNTSVILQCRDCNVEQCFKIDDDNEEEGARI